MGIKAQAPQWEKGLTLAPHLEGGLAQPWLLHCRSPLPGRDTPAAELQANLPCFCLSGNEKALRSVGRSAERPAPQLTEHSAPGWPLLQNTKDSKLAELEGPPLQSRQLLWQHLEVHSLPEEGDRAAGPGKLWQPGPPLISGLGGGWKRLGHISPQSCLVLSDCLISVLSRRH